MSPRRHSIVSLPWSSLIAFAASKKNGLRKSKSLSDRAGIMIFRSALPTRWSMAWYGLNCKVPSVLPRQSRCHSKSRSVGLTLQCVAIYSLALPLCLPTGLPFSKVASSGSNSAVHLAGGQCAPVPKKLWSSSRHLGSISPPPQ